MNDIIICSNIWVNLPLLSEDPQNLLENCFNSMSQCPLRPFRPHKMMGGGIEKSKFLRQGPMPFSRAFPGAVPCRPKGSCQPVVGGTIEFVRGQPQADSFGEGKGHGWMPSKQPKFDFDGQRKAKFVEASRHWPIWHMPNAVGNGCRWCPPICSLFCQQKAAGFWPEAGQTALNVPNMASRQLAHWR